MAAVLLMQRTAAVSGALAPVAEVPIAVMEVLGPLSVAAAAAAAAAVSVTVSGPGAVVTVWVVWAAAAALPEVTVWRREGWLPCWRRTGV
jgi:hypothetical protein